MSITTRFPESKEIKKFEVEVVSHSKNAEDIFEILKKDGNRSDHLFIMHAESVASTWNTLKKCRIEFEAGTTKIKEINNGFKQREELDTYIARLKSNLTYFCQSARTHNKTLSNIPISVLCMQEITADALTAAEMDNIVKTSGFTTWVDSSTEHKTDSYLMQKYAVKHKDLLVMAYDPTKVKYIETCVLPTSISEIQQKENCFQAVKFFDKTIAQEFVIVNLHQNSHAVNRHGTEEPVAANDIARLLEHFQKQGIACILTGDFNTKNIRLSAEAGKMVVGHQANMYWDLEKEMYQPDSCDHVIMNEVYYRQFLPSLKKTLLQQTTPSDHPFSTFFLPSSAKKADSIEKTFKAFII